ncbi:hypothetical protein ACSSS7_000189 [Eimeria intestinalis]
MLLTAADAVAARRRWGASGPWIEGLASSLFWAQKEFLTHNKLYFTRFAAQRAAALQQRLRSSVAPTATSHDRVAAAAAAAGAPAAAE